MTEHENEIRTWRRRLVAVALGGLTVVTGIGIAWRVDTDNRRANACQGQVRDQERARAMWLYLLEQNPSNPKAPEFRIALDQIIPPLKCVRGSSVAVPDTTTTIP